MKIPAGTYRLTLTHEQSGVVTFDHHQIPAESVRAVAASMVQMQPAIKASRAAENVIDGLNEIWELIRPVAKRRRRVSR